MPGRINEPQLKNNTNKASWPKYDDISEPRMVALYTANGSGTKLYQGFLDGHPQIYMIPGYPLMYFYPHWNQWKKELRKHWTWEALIDVFCVKHASVIDSRRIPGHDGMTKLGKNQDEYISIDEDLFRSFLAHLLDGHPISARTFLLAIHYAYAFCREEELSKKKVLVYHIHVHEYVRDYLLSDFDDALILGTVRDPRSNIRGRYYSSEAGVDLIKMNKTDAMAYRCRVYYFIMRYFYEGLDILHDCTLERLRVIRHEDLFFRPSEVMKATLEFMGIDDHPCVKVITFGRLLWWGDSVYDMEPMNTVNPKVVSQDWKKHTHSVDWYVFEGLFSRYMEKYDYKLFKYKGNLKRQILLFVAMLLPSKIEREVFGNYLSIKNIKEYYRACLDEASGRVALKDYSFNAYYRHKWTQKDLRLYRSRFYVEFLKKSLKKSKENNSVKNRLRLKVAQFVYLYVNSCRYISSVVLCPIMIFRRWRITGEAFLRMLQKRNVLPDTLP